MARTKKASKVLVAQCASMWPREIFDCKEGGKLVGRRDELGVVLNQPGVYVLYRDDIPHYIGKADKLGSRLHHHANRPGSRYHNFWNYFSAFVVEDTAHRSEVEGILIAAMPTANSSTPRWAREKFPRKLRDMIRELRQGRAELYRQRHES